MGSEQYCLRWNDFQSNITGSFSDIRDDEDFLDVTLVSDGQTIKAHKLVLSACSPLFRSMMKKNTHPQPMIFLHGVRFADITAILNFMYHGEVNVNQEDLQTFLAAAEELRIRGLSDKSGAGGAVEAGEKRASQSPSPSAAKRSRDAYSNHLNASSSGSERQQQQRRRNGSQSPSTPASRRGSDMEDVSKRSMVITPDMPPGDYQDNSSSQSEQGFENYNTPYAEQNLYRSGRMNDDGANGMQGGGLLGAASSAAASSQFWSSFPGGAAGAAAGALLDQSSFLQQQAASPRSVCPYCHKELKNPHSLNVHISRYHSEGSQSAVEVICPVCERKYGNKYSLRTHMHLNHKDQLHLIGSGRKARRNIEEASPAMVNAMMGQKSQDDDEKAGGGDTPNTSRSAASAGRSPSASVIRGGTPSASVITKEEHFYYN